MTYQPHIDGLRAIAVFSVILFHADERIIPGGYLGVVVFFVISGFLITSFIVSDLDTGKFSLSDFYERRIRRIFPILFLVLAATMPFAAMLLLPSQQEAYAQSMLATFLFSSNIFFWMETGYFMPEAELKPLLHTWSLGVEEQFYIFYPLMLVAIWRFGQKVRIAILGLIFVLSLTASIYLSQTHPGANFYLLPTRAWELMAGALLALAPIDIMRNTWYSGWLGLFGFSMLGCSLFLLDAGMAIPSHWGLIPVGGTVLLIGFASTRSWVGRMLAHPVLVQIGLISFSAYLWHWPILVFARMRYGAALDPIVLAGLVGFILFLSYLSWRLVEQPFRGRGQRAWIPFRAFTVILVAVAGTLVGLSNVPGARILGATVMAGETADFTTPAGIEAQLAVNFGLNEVCEGSFTLSPTCRTSDTPEAMLWGDSFAMHLAHAIDAGVGARGMIQHTKSVCAPMVDISVVTPQYPGAWADGCIAFNDQVLDWLAGQNSVQYVIVSSPFGLIFNDVYLRDGTVVTAPRPEIVRDKLLKTAARIRSMGKTMVIVSPPPVTGENIGQCLSSAVLRGARKDACDFTTDQIHRLSQSVFAFLHDISAEIPVVFLDEILCKNGVCVTRIEDMFVFRDSGHLSIAASRYLGEQRALYLRIQHQSRMN